MSNYYGLIEMSFFFGTILFFSGWALVSAIRQDNEEKAKARLEAEQAPTGGGGDDADDRSLDSPEE
ncbi:MAG: hypothetical protein AAF928_03090 [Myxococcota bacterium]